jgi:squalene-associated FAD-dependent desaturase
MKPRIAVIGAGWAGLAAAVELCDRAQVTLFEAGRAPGGRARRIRAQGQALDNGQHLLLGAYGECLRLMRRVGVNPETALLRLPLSWVQFDGMRMRCPPLPAPWHLLCGLWRAQGLSAGNKWRLVRALTALRIAGWRVSGDPTVEDWMRRHGQGEDLLASFWRPLVLAAMNTPLEIASMRILAQVLRDSLGARQSASDLLLPRCDLSALFPEPACDWLRAQGVSLRFAQRVATLSPDAQGGVELDGEHFDAAIVACAPYHASRLLADAKLQDAVKELTFLPICTVYLCFERMPVLPACMTGLKQGTAQWLFDRETLCQETGLLAVVISAPDAALAQGDALVAQVMDDLRRLEPRLPALLWSRVLRDPRATFAARAGISRPGMRIGVQSVLLAGDWVEGDYPATLEGAVRSGVAAARIIMQDLNQKSENNHV